LVINNEVHNGTDRLQKDSQKTSRQLEGTYQRLENSEFHIDAPKPKKQKWKSKKRDEETHHENDP